MQELRENWTFTKMTARVRATALMGVAAAFLHNKGRAIVISLVVSQFGEVTRGCRISGVSAFSGLG
jgi:hypothetical protein